MMIPMDFDRYIVKAFKVSLYRCEDVWSPLSRYSEGLTRVQYEDPKPARKVVYEFAKYFRREFGYDFVQYDLEPGLNDWDDNTFAFLFHHHAFDPRHDRIAYGACCFRYRKHYTNLEEHWALQWIWLHPLCRGQGELTRHWNVFEELFGNFMIEEPLSKSMEYFIKNKSSKYTHQYKDILKPNESLT